MMGNAHNYTKSVLPMYRFLCEMQYEKCSPTLSFNWGSLENMFFYFPKVQLEHNIILYPATWIFKNEEINKLIINLNSTTDSFKKYRKSLKLPEKYILLRGIMNY